MTAPPPTGQIPREPDASASSADSPSTTPVAGPEPPNQSRTDGPQPLPDGRAEPAFCSDERTMLAGWLRFHRDTLVAKCAGLTDGELRSRSVPPSTLSLIGLLRHMVEVERHWFRAVLAGEEVEPEYCTEEDPDGDFNDTAGAELAPTLATWQAECTRSDAVVAALPSLDDGGRSRGRPVSARWVLTHMIEEYARHNGHADVLREAIDGATGL